MPNKFFTTICFVLMLTLPALAAEKKGVELTSTAEVEIIVKNDKGEKETQRVAAANANVVPGDTVIFTTRYENQGSQPATNVVIKNPLPEHMLYLENSAAGKNTRIEFSSDGGKNFAPANKLKVKEGDGKERAATAADYTHIRWITEGALEKGARGSVSYKAKVK